MLQTGLLWFDDDAKRPLVEKIADAVARYSERVGGAPTICQLNPASAALVIQQRQQLRQQRGQQRAGKRERTTGMGRHRAVPGAQPHIARLPHLIPDPSLPVSYFLVGREEVTREVVTDAPNTSSSRLDNVSAGGEQVVAESRPGARRATIRRQNDTMVDHSVAQATAHVRHPKQAEPKKPGSEPDAAPTPTSAAPTPKRLRVKQSRAPRTTMAPAMLSPSSVASAPGNRARREPGNRTKREGATQTSRHARAVARKQVPSQTPLQARPSRAAEPPARVPTSAPIRRHKTSRPLTQVMQPSLPLFVADDTVPAKHPRRRAS